jgi:FdhE protein
LDAALTAGLTRFWLTAAEPTDFHVRAFLEPLVTTLAAAFVEAPSDQDRRQCFACSSLPQISVLRDRPDAVGARSLVCSMCATEWRFPRLTCTHCGETTANRLPVHTAESVPHVRIDTCLTCQRYLKSVDLRLQGDAVPIVDDVATVELDLWAKDQGLTKIRTNVLGF